MRVYQKVLWVVGLVALGAFSLAGFLADAGLISRFTVYLALTRMWGELVIRLTAGAIFLFLLALGTHEGLDKLRPGINLPRIVPFGLPTSADFTFALFALVLPQIPMTLGNAVIAYADLSREYFGDDSRRITHRGACIGMALANFLSFFLGGMPLCHGAGGLAAHYRFGARTAGANLIIGSILVALAIFLGNHALSTLTLLPMSVLGVLLFFAGSQLAMTVIDTKDRKDLFVTLVILGITLASNLGVGFLVGIAIAYTLKSDRLTV